MGDWMFKDKIDSPAEKPRQSFGAAFYDVLRVFIPLSGLTVIFHNWELLSPLVMATRDFNVWLIAWMCSFVPSSPQLLVALRDGIGLQFLMLAFEYVAACHTLLWVGKTFFRGITTRRTK